MIFQKRKEKKERYFVGAISYMVQLATSVLLCVPFSLSPDTGCFRVLKGLPHAMDLAFDDMKYEKSSYLKIFSFFTGVVDSGD